MPQRLMYSSLSLSLGLDVRTEKRVIAAKKVDLPFERGVRVRHLRLAQPSTGTKLFLDTWKKDESGSSNMPSRVLKKP